MYSWESSEDLDPFKNWTAKCAKSSIIQPRILDTSISFKSNTEFEHVTLDVPQKFKVKGSLAWHCDLFFTTFTTFTTCSITYSDIADLYIYVT